MTLLHVAILSFVFILVNGLFVAAEFALIATPRPALEERAARGDRVSRRLLDILSTPLRQDRYVATAQLGVTLASLGLGMFGEHVLATVLEGHIGPIPFIGRAAAATALSLGLLTIAHIVLGEMLPKGIALQHPEDVAKITHRPMLVTFYAFYPIIAALNVVARACLAGLGVRRTEANAEPVYTPEELQLIVEESEEAGVVRRDAGRMIRELFEFADRTAGHVMVPRVRVVGIPIDITAEELRAIAYRGRRTRYPVYDGDLDHIVGMVHAKDLLRRVVKGETIDRADLRRIPVIPDSASLDDVLETMHRGQAHMAVVIDEHGGTAGIVNLEDLFEEVVGELDEGAPNAPAIVTGQNGAVVVSGTLRLDELGQYFGVEIEHDVVDSVSGLVLQQLGRPPEVGDVVEYGRFRLEVTAVSGRGVGRAAVTFAAPETDAS